MKIKEHCIMLLEKAKEGKIRLTNNDIDTIIKCIKEE